MATGSLLAASSTVIYQFGRSTALTTKPNSLAVGLSVLARDTMLQRKGSHILRKKNCLNIFMVMQQTRNENENEAIEKSDTEKISDSIKGYNHVTLSRVEERLARKKLERTTYLLAATLSSLGISAMAIMAVYYRFSWQMEVTTQL